MKREVWEMTDKELGEVLQRSYRVVGEEGATAVSVWTAQQAFAEAENRLRTYGDTLGLKFGKVRIKGSKHGVGED